MLFHRIPYGVKVVLLTAIYYAAAKFGLLFAFINSNASVIWPPAGLAIVSLLLLGWRLFPGIALGAFLVNAETPIPISCAIGITLGNTLEALFGYYLLHRVVRFQNSLGRIRDVLGLVLLSAFASTTVSATIGVGSLAIGGAIPWDTLSEAWRTWWIGDAVGILIVAPMLLLWSQKSARKLEQRECLEAAVLYLSLIGVSLIIFGGYYDYSYPLFPLLVWAALRFEQRGAATATFLVSGIAIWHTAKNMGVFAASTINQQFSMLQTFNGTMAITGLLLATMIYGRRRAEEALQRKITELKEFAHTVSHDLKAPLRGIMGYSDELSHDHRSQLSERARFCIDRVALATMKMNRLIDDLLAYSRLDVETVKLDDVSLRGLIDTIVKDYSQCIAERQVEISVEIPAITVRTWERGLTQVLTNLIDNALKYSRDSRPPRVNIQGKELRSVFRLSITDNGIGFDMQSHDLIFGLFNRLVRPDEFEGTGAGLAIVKKVVEKQSGRVWAESVPGTGTTFFVELPKKGMALESSIQTRE